MKIIKPILDGIKLRADDITDRCRYYNALRKGRSTENRDPMHYYSGIDLDNSPVYRKSRILEEIGSKLPAVKDVANEREPDVAYGALKVKMA